MSDVEAVALLILYILQPAVCIAWLVFEWRRFRELRTESKRLDAALKALDRLNQRT